MTDTAETDTVLSGLDAITGELEDLYRDVHQHPELSMQEHDTAAKPAVAKDVPSTGLPRSCGKRISPGQPLLGGVPVGRTNLHASCTPPPPVIVTSCVVGPPTRAAAEAPAQTVWLAGLGAEIDSGMRSCAPMSTIGGVPEPVFGAARSNMIFHSRGLATPGMLDIRAVSG